MPLPRKSQMRPVLSIDFIQASFGSTRPCFIRVNRLSFIVVIPCFFEVCMMEGKEMDCRKGR